MKRLVLCLVGVFLPSSVYCAESQDVLAQRLDMQDFYAEKEKELESEKIKARELLQQVRVLAVNENPYAQEIARLCQQALQPLSELAEEETVKLAAYATGASGTSGSNQPWYWASAVGTTGTKYGYGNTVSAATSNALLVADGKASPAQQTVVTKTYYGSYNGYTATSTVSQADANTKAQAAWQAAQPKVYTGVYNGYTATSTVSQADANTKAQAAWQAAQPKVYTGVYNGYTATSTVSQADANTKAQAAWQAAQPPVYNSNCFGYTAQGASQAEADNRARSYWMSARLPGGMVVSGGSYASIGWLPITNGSQGNLKLTFNGLATNDLLIGLQYGGSNYLEVVVGGWSNTSSVVRIFQNGVQQGGDIGATSPNPVIPSVGNVSAFTLLVSGSTLTVSVGGSVILSCTNSAFNQTFTAYSFKAFSTSYWAVSGSVATSTSFTGSYNGISKTSTVSQADAIAQAQAAWTAIETGTISPALAAYTTAQNNYVTELNKAKAMVNELIDIFKADSVASVDISSWVKLQ